MNNCENCGSKLRTCGKCGWSKVHEEDMSALKQEIERLTEALSGAHHIVKLTEKSRKCSEEAARFAGKGLEVAIQNNKQLKSVIDAAQARITELESLLHPNNRPDVQTRSAHDTALETVFREIKEGTA